MSAPNRNVYFAEVFVDELARSGLRAVCIAPGSRSTPLVLAFAAHPAITVYSHIDERSAAFFALGLARASDQPVALVCSSGTATANFYPAIIEAHYSRVPLLVLTADRPPEVRESGANQTVDQVKMYGDHVLWSVDAALPEADPPALTIRSVRTLACRVYALADGMPKGAVHVNFPFRKPLEPTPVATDVTDVPDAAARADGQPFTFMRRGTFMPTNAQLAPLVDAIEAAERGLIVCGTRTPGGEFPTMVEALSRATGYPILADPLSGVRYHSAVGRAIGGYEGCIQQALTWEAPDVILYFGAIPTSQALEDYLEAVAPRVRVWISGDGVWNDATHRADALLHADPILVCMALTSALRARDPDAERMRSVSAWSARWYAADAAVHTAMASAVADGGYFDGAAVYDTLELVPEETVIHIASSLPVRHLDTFGIVQGKTLTTYGNRGASGIDGTISSALGATAAHPDRTTVLITGDLSFYHDMNGLLAIGRLGLRLVIVLLNNKGGGIFRRLPIAQFEPPFTELFVTPHGLDFSHAAALYGLAYARADTRPTFRHALLEALRSPGSSVIEVPTTIEADHARRRDVMARVSAAAALTLHDRG